MDAIHLKSRETLRHYVLIGTKRNVVHAVWSLLNCYVPNKALPLSLWISLIKEIGDLLKVESRIRHDSGTARVSQGPAEYEDSSSTPGSESLTLS